ncbi:hypothetical protein BCL79_1182 [Stenotrophomonas rhizophila]|uniref:Uncharacterized protein n=1 Tax=Stenotrophomonas rhizophila TaxID=216778 RepID=A0A498CHQ9_9GAMM|nr:hypothetical protein BCL79_1182 [Stenotrophomonas rhizophila]
MTCGGMEQHSCQVPDARVCGVFVGVRLMARNIAVTAALAFVRMNRFGDGRRCAERQAWCGCITGVTPGDTGGYGADSGWIPGERSASLFTGGGGRRVERWANATVAGGCPPAPACGRLLLLDFAHKRSAAHRVQPLAPHGKHRFAVRLPPRTSPEAAGRRLGKIKEEAVAARRRPGDICRGACRSLRGVTLAATPSGKKRPALAGLWVVRSCLHQDVRSSPSSTPRLVDGLS